MKFKNILKSILLEQDWATQGKWDMTGSAPVDITPEKYKTTSKVSNTSSSGSKTTISTSGDSKRVIDFFVSKGLKPHQAAGIAANFQAESGFNPRSVGDNGTSIGLAQWHDTRAADLKNWAKSNGKKWDDFDTQLEYTWVTLNDKYQSVLNKLKSSNDTDESTEAFMLGYEKPSNQSTSAIQKRQKIAQSYVSTSSSTSTSNDELKNYFSKPLPTMILPKGNQRWGTPRPYGPHSGIDISAKVGTPIYSIMDGEIISVSTKGRCGNGLTIKNGDWTYSFCHAKRLYKKDGFVSAGEQIGEVGTTGSSDGSHLHFTIKYKNKPVDPTPYFF